MPGIFEPSDIPAWMNPTRNIMETGRQATVGISRNFSEAFGQAQQQKNQKEMLDYKQTQLQKENQRLAGKAVPIATALQGVQSPEESWKIVSQNPQWLADPDTAPFVGQYLKTQADVAKAEQATIAGQVAIADASEFAKRVSAVDAETRAGLKAMKPNPDGTPSPMQWQALGLAEERMKVQAENTRKAAEIEALRRGDQPTTTINEKGVSTVYKPATTTAPQELSLSDGSTIVYNPKTGAFKFSAKNGAAKDLTNAQLLAIATHLQKIDAEDPNAKKIQDFLAKQATGQIGGTNSTSTSTGTLKYNPQTGKIE